MPTHQHHKIDGKAFNAGANRDFDEEFLGELEEGEYLDARNMHPTRVGGDALALSSISGDTELHDLINNACNLVAAALTPNFALYECQCIMEVNDDIFDIWVPPVATPQDPSIMRVNGIIVCMTTDLPFRQTHPLQYHKNESCIGGEVYLTDNRTPPLIFNIEDLKDNGGITDPTICTDRYFGSFDIANFTVNLTAPGNVPYFLGLVQVGAVGLDTGEYQYSFRYINSQGDRTQWCQHTPPIPVPASSINIVDATNVTNVNGWAWANNPTPQGADGSNREPIYPYTKTFGGAPTLGSLNQTQYGVKLKIRIDNVLDYEYIQIQRVDYNLGQAFMPPTATTVIAEIPIVPQQCDIIEFTDPDPNFATITVVIDEEEALGMLRIIDRAKAVRYYDNRLYFMNVKDASQVVEDVTFNTATLGTELQPIIHSTGKVGQYDPYNHTYHKPYLTGEKYGFAVVFYDFFNNPSFALPIVGTTSDSWVRDASGNILPNDFESYQMPDRRTAMPAVSQTFSYDGFCTAANDQGAVTPVFEVFDHANGIRKDNVCPFVNIMETNNDPNNILNVGSQWVGKAFTKLNNDDNYGCFDCDLTAGQMHDLVANSTVLGVDVYFIPPAFWGPFTTLAPAHPSNIGFRPYYPTQQSSWTTNSGGGQGRAAHDYVTTVKVGHGSNVLNKSGSYSSMQPYCPEGFSLNYHLLGVAIDGINTGSIPSWVSGFSVVRSETAGRIVCQGLGYYSMISGNATLNATQKWRNQIWFYSPDTDPNYGFRVPNMQQVADSVQQLGVAAPFQIQLVSPLGFFTEIYKFMFEPLNQWYRVDMITYNTILRDTGQINPGEYSYMGITTGAATNYVGFGKWRSQYPSSSQSGSFTTYHQQGTTGNTFDSVGVQTTTFNIVEMYQVTSGRQTYWKISTDRPIYANRTAGTGSNPGVTGRGFDDDEMQDWSEPTYMVNIIRQGAEVARGTVNTYYHTGTHINLNSTIARITQDMVDTQTHYNWQLSDERIEDCAPHPSSATTATDNRFVWVNNRAWLNVTYKTNVEISGYIASIGAFQGLTNLTVGGIDVFGLFTHTDDAVVAGSIAENRNFTLHFERPVIWNASPLFIWELQDEDIVRVRYDNTAPIRVWGGDSNVGDAVWAPIDLKHRRDHTPNDDNDFSPTPEQHWWEDGTAAAVNNLPNPNPGWQSSKRAFRLTNAFPFRFYDMNPRIYQCQTKNAYNRIQDQETMGFSNDTTVNQLASKFVVESRVNMTFQYSEPNSAGDGQFFPGVHYVQRPLEWNAGDPYEYIMGAYDTTYPNESSRFGLGGFRCWPQVNWDYSSRAEAVMEFSRPIVGFRDESIFCTRIIWSEKRDVNVQDSPGVRTFPVQNFYDISDNTGEIKFAWDALSDKGSNLYSITDSGICMLITNKRTLSSVEGADFTSIALEQADMAVTDQFWINKTTGMSDEFWRSAAEFENSLYFANKSSVYLLLNNQAKDIGRIKYFSKIFPYVALAADGYGTKMAGCYDTKHKEYWLSIHGAYYNPVALVWSDLVEHWVGEYDFDYTKYMSFNNRTFGARDGDGLFELHQDAVFTLGGTNIVSYVDQASSKQSSYGKEFFRFRINSNTIPSSVDFLQANVYPTVVVEGSVASGIMKSYDGFEQYIPRKTTDGFRNQGRLLIYRINHIFANQRFIIKSAIINYKLLK